LEAAVNVLVIGSGGREHAILHALSKSKHAPRLYCSPGNAGTAALAQNVPVGSDDISQILSWLKEHPMDLVVVGPEAPLTLGLADELEKRGVSVFGPSKAGAQVESSKDFTKSLLFENHIPTAVSRTFIDSSEAVAYVKAHGAPVVIKADGLAAGKGVTVCMKIEEALQAVDAAMNQKIFGAAGSKVVVEDFLDGEEASLLAFVDGETIVPMVSAQDHKRVNDGDQGPNTGGMGAYSPAPVLTPELNRQVLEKILKPTLAGLKKRGIVYKGVFYAGLMITKDGPQVIEYNCRFGDPETQVILPRLKSDFLDICLAVAQGRLSGVPVEWDERCSAGVVLAAPGYPGHYTKGAVITGLEDAATLPGVFVYHAGTVSKGNATVTSGGRVLCVTGLGVDIRKAIERAYQAVEKIHFEGVHYRKDIGWRALNRR
jgi:phosphoribosylamine--glycine ligase